MGYNQQVLIVTGGNAVSEILLRSKMEESQFVIAADGGIKNFIKAGLKPDLIVGDFDSAPEQEWYHLFPDVAVVTFPPEKDYTDTELAISEALKRSEQNVLILGGIGSRMDHTLANMMLLQQLHDAGKLASIQDDHNLIRVIDCGSTRISGSGWHYFSLIPLTESINVTLIGFKYPLDAAEIPQASTITISNELIKEEATVHLHKGRAFAILSRD